MCFGGGGSPAPEPVSEPVKEQQKAQKEEETKRKIERRQEEKEETIQAETPIETSLTYETGAKADQRVMRGSRGRRALYTSQRGGIGYRNPLL